ncbi:MAG: hypothetical protein WKG03_16960 [Telluria sp.]
MVRAAIVDQPKPPIPAIALEMIARGRGVNGFQKARNFGFCTRFSIWHETHRGRLPAPVLIDERSLVEVPFEIPGELEKVDGTNRTILSVRMLPPANGRMQFL